MSFYYLNQNATNVSSPFDNMGLNDKKFNLENFENMPPVDQSKSDSSYQCSDNVQLTGNAIGFIGCDISYKYCCSCFIILIISGTILSTVK